MREPQTIQYPRQPFSRFKFINELHLLTNAELVSELAAEITFTHSALKMAETLEHTRQAIDEGVMDAIFKEVADRLLDSRSRLR